jgi:NitT/TauT family transport system permease protein
MSNTALSGDLQEFEVSRQRVKPGRRFGFKRTALVIGLRVLVAVVIVLGWQFISGRWIPTFAISKPTDVVRTLGNYVTSSEGFTDIKTSLEELLLGYAIGVGAGLLFGIIFAAWQLGASIFEPFLTAFNGIPKVALAPAFLIALGLGIWSKVAISSMTVFFVMFYNTYYGARAMNNDLANVVRLMGANRIDLLRDVMLPGILPTVIAGLKAGVPFSIIGVVVGEFVAATAGVGYYINNSTQGYDPAGTYAGIIVLVVIVLILSSLVGLVERFALRWQRVRT